MRKLTIPYCARHDSNILHALENARGIISKCEPRAVVAIMAQPRTLATNRAAFVAFYLACAIDVKKDGRGEFLERTHRQVQQPVLDRGGSRARGGTVGPLRLELAEDEWSSLGAITGKRSGGLLEASPRLSSCITNVAVVLMRNVSRIVQRQQQKRFKSACQTPACISGRALRLHSPCGKETWGRSGIGMDAERLEGKS